MRRELSHEFPLWSHVFGGFRPEHLDTLTLREIGYYRLSADQYRASVEEANRG